MDGFLFSPSPVWIFEPHHKATSIVFHLVSHFEECFIAMCYSEVCDFMHIWTWAIRPGTSMNHPFIWPYILRYFQQVLIWTAWVHQIFKDDFEEIVIQGDRLCSCCNHMGFFSKRSDNAGEKKRDVEKQCGIWGGSISFTLSHSWCEKLQKKFQMQWGTIRWGIHFEDAEESASVQVGYPILFLVGKLCFCFPNTGTRFYRIWVPWSSQPQWTCYAGFIKTPGAPTTLGNMIFWISRETSTLLESPTLSLEMNLNKYWS